jgi:hypothetical protein
MITTVLDTAKLSSITADHRNRIYKKSEENLYFNSGISILIGLSKRNGVTFLTYYFRIILRNVRARKFVQAPFDAARHALFML